MVSSQAAPRLFIFHLSRSSTRKAGHSQGGRFTLVSVKVGHKQLVAFFLYASLQWSGSSGLHCFPTFLTWLPCVFVLGLTISLLHYFLPLHMCMVYSSASFHFVIPLFPLLPKKNIWEWMLTKKRAAFIASEWCTLVDFLFVFLACYYLVSPRSLLPSYGLPALSVLFQCLQALKLNAFLCPGHPLQV